MAHKTSKAMDFSIDNAAGSLTSIKGSTNNSALQGIQDALDDSGLGDGERTYVHGLAGATLPINGWVNSTTEAIFGPLIGNRTTVTNGIQHYTGEALVQDPTFSGNVGELQAWSANLQVTGAITATSVAPS